MTDEHRALTPHVGIPLGACVFTAFLAGLAALDGRAATLTVSNTSASGPGSLQQAILDANAADGLDTIVFQISGAGVRTITPTNALPSITYPVVIDGTSQPGFAGTPLIELNGANAGPASAGFRLPAGKSIIRGLAINRFGGAGIHVQAPGGTNFIQGNFVGTDPTGTLNRGNGYSPPPSGGIWIDGSSGNWIGGPYLTNRNLISANIGSGLYLYNCSGNTVQGNLIGTTLAGTAALANTANGVSLYNAGSNLIGGSLAAERNLISGNNGSGVYLYGTLSVGNLVQGNTIGPGIHGTNALGNLASGIQLYGASGNTIGGTNAGSGNVICRNGYYGLEISGGATGNLIQGNHIGVDASGNVALGNWASGVCVASSTSNLIGGTVAQARNVISGNVAMGILLTNCVGNMVAGNFIGTDVTGTNGLGNGLVGVQITGASSNVVGGLSAGARNVISGNTGSGLELRAGACANVIQGNFIGTDQTGRWAVSNRVDGVHIRSGGNIIGGGGAGAGNLISGNATNGVLLNGAQATGNLIQGNFIGTDVAGSTSIPNRFAGVGISGAPSNTIGGSIAGHGNLISGNGAYNNQGGIYLIGAGATGNVILGNRIGTDLAGMAALGNRYEGIFVTNAGYNIIGGSMAGAGNLISANGSHGIFLSPAWGTIIQGNWIGVDATGTTALGNGRIVLAAAVELEAGAHDNLVGGQEAGAGNSIAFAPEIRAGVRVRDGSTNNAILGNSIFSNASLGIDLGAYGPNSNIACGAGSGANMRQNYPVLAQAASGTGTTIRGSLNSRRNTTFLLQFFASPACDPSGCGEGQFYVGQTTITTDSNCTNRFSVSFPTPVPIGYVITATATDSANNSSEFSACVSVFAAPVPPPLTIASLAASNQVALAWTNTPPGFVLKQTDSLSPPVLWATVTNNPVLTNGQWTVIVSAVTSNRFFRLSFE